MFVRRRVTAVVSAFVSYGGWERKTRVSCCAHQCASACLVNHWSYWGSFNAASLTFWRHFTKGLSHHSELSSHLKQIYQRVLLVAVSAVLAKASRFLRAASDDQNRGLKTKRNWTNQYRPQWSMKQLAQRSWGWGHTHAHTCALITKAPIVLVFYWLLDIKYHKPYAIANTIQ